MDIDIRGLWFSYPGEILALRNISVKICHGEQIAIVGQNGAGKSTFVKHINGLLRPSKGSVHIGEWDTNEKTAAQLASRVGFVFQNPDQQLFSSTVLEEVSFGPRNLNYDDSKINALVEDALQLTNLKGKENINPYEFSPTWRKMVAIASIISMDTPIVIFDEPTTGQDSVNIDKIAMIINTLRERGKTVITITHDIDFGADNFDRIIALGDGRVLLDGTTQEVIYQDQVLATTYVDPPQLARLSKGLGFSDIAYREDGFIELLREKSHLNLNPNQ